MTEKDKMIDELENEYANTNDAIDYDHWLENNVIELREELKDTKEELRITKKHLTEIKNKYDILKGRLDQALEIAYTRDKVKEIWQKHKTPVPDGDFNIDMMTFAGFTRAIHEFLELIKNK